MSSACSRRARRTSSRGTASARPTCCCAWRRAEAMLLLKTATLSLPPERELAVAGGAVETFPVAAGQLLTISDVAGGQPAALFAVAVDDPRHFVSPHHTRVVSNSFLLRLGLRLVTE